DHLYIKATSPTYNITTVIKYGRGHHPAEPRITDQQGYYYMAYNIPAQAWTEELYPLASTIGTLTQPKIIRNDRGDMLLVGGANDRIYNRAQQYWVDDISGSHAIPGPAPVWSSVAIPVAFTTRRISVDRQSRVKRLKYGMLGVDGDKCTPELSYIVDGALKDISYADPGIV